MTRDNLIEKLGYEMEKEALIRAMMKASSKNKEFDVVKWKLKREMQRIKLK